jgi:ABC-type uncharacterized transport system substrate-binding protein
MQRRNLLIALGGALAAPVGAFAQPKGRVWRIGFFYFGSRESATGGRYEQFLKGMHDLGYIEGKNFAVEARYADGVSERLPALAAELFKSKVDVIVATGTPAYLALKEAGTAVPVVITASADPVGDGIAASLAKPGGMFTGLATGNMELYPKHIELLKTALPKLSRVAVLWNSANAAHLGRLKHMQAVAQKTGIKASPVGAATAREIENGFATMTRERAEAVIIISDTFFVQQQRQIAGLAIEHRLPSIWGGTQYAEAGGFISYGQYSLDNFRRAASYVDKILKGAKPGELPIEQPARLEMVINLKTAKAIGLTVSRDLLFRADKVIE